MVVEMQNILIYLRIIFAMNIENYYLQSYLLKFTVKKQIMLSIYKMHVNLQTDEFNSKIFKQYPLNKLPKLSKFKEKFAAL